MPAQILDRNGTPWDTSLTRKGVRAIEQWKYEVQVYRPGAVPDDSSDLDDPKFQGKWVKVERLLNVDVSNLEQMLQLELSPSKFAEVIKAWLHPQWSKTMSADEFEDLLDPEFQARAVAALGERLRSFYTGRLGSSAVQELESALERELRARIRQSIESALKNAGPNTPGSSDSGGTPTT